MGQGAIFPVVPVRVGEDDTADVRPGSANGGQASAELTRPKPEVDEDAKVVGFDQGSIPAAPAGQDCEAQGHFLSQRGNHPSHVTRVYRSFPSMVGKKIGSC